MASLYGRFLPLLPPDGDTLDAGCRPGRDARAFRDMGYRVRAFDASARMAEIASRRLGEPVEVRRVQDLDWDGPFDGVWACASLLHVPRGELATSIARLARALRPGGVI